jgi:hypothetical protein
MAESDPVSPENRNPEKFHLQFGEKRTWPPIERLPKVISGGATLARPLARDTWASQPGAALRFGQAMLWRAVGAKQPEMTLGYLL